MRYLLSRGEASGRAIADQVEQAMIAESGCELNYTAKKISMAQATSFLEATTDAIDPSTAIISWSRSPLSSLSALPALSMDPNACYAYLNLIADAGWYN